MSINMLIFRFIASLQFTKKLADCFSSCQSKSQLKSLFQFQGITKIVKYDNWPTSAPACKIWKNQDSYVCTLKDGANKQPLVKHAKLEKNENVWVELSTC